MLDATRLRHPALFAKTVSPDQAASLITDGMNVGIGGFTPSGYPKQTTLALAEQIRHGKRCRIQIWSGASLGPEVEETLAVVHGVAGRAPYYAASNRTMQRQINDREIAYVDVHLSEFAQQIDYGFWGDVDVAIVEAAAITEQGDIVLGSGVGNIPMFVRHAKHIIVEVNTSIPLEIEGMHDLFILDKPPHRREIPIYSPTDRIGSPYLHCGIDRIDAIVESDIPDHVRTLSAPTPATKAIAGHLIEFLEHEVKCGRIPAELLPIQSGVGTIANAVLMGLSESHFPALTMYSEILQDAVFHLIRSGHVRAASGCAFTPSPAVWEMFRDDPECYRRAVVLRPLDISNNPEVIRRLGVIAINTPIEFDIYGQANSTHAFGSKMINGIGGSGDYMRNAYLSIFTTPSVGKGGTISKIVPMVSHADHTEHDSQIFITEYGVADTRGLAPVARAETIIEHCAHPDFRPLLRDYLHTALRHGGHEPVDLAAAFQLPLHILAEQSKPPVSHKEVTMHTAQEQFHEAQQHYEDRVAAATARFPERPSLRARRLYTLEDVESLDYTQDLGFPGAYPFTRGIQPTMYRGRLWTMRQYSGIASAEETNDLYKYLLSMGTTGLSVAMDLPTQIGLDSDSPLAAGEVGKVGVAIDSLRDMEDIFDGIPLGKVSTSMTINGPAAVLLAMYIAVGKRQGVAPKDLRGTIQNDILKEYIARGTYIFPPRPSMRLVTDTFAYCSQEIPHWNTISVGAYHIREAGASMVQEVAFAFANAIAYIEASLAAGQNVDDFAPNISWIFTAGLDFFPEVAKFRAARRLWAKLMKERFGATKAKAQMLRFHVHTAGSVLTAQQPDNNIVRITWQAMAAILGGTQSLATCAKDEALSIPTRESATLALRTQQLLAHESGIADTIDPLAGSYYIEHLTNEIETQAMEYIRKIDKLGGAVAAIEAGYMQSEMAAHAYAHQKSIESKERIVVGVNEFADTETHPQGDILHVDPGVGVRQVEKLHRLKQTRDSDAVRAALLRLRRVARSDENLMPCLIDTVETYATLGEICDVLREEFGEYAQPKIAF